MDKKFIVGGFVNEFVLDIHETGLPVEVEFLTAGNCRVLSFEKIFDKLHVYVYSTNNDLLNTCRLKLFIMEAIGDVPVGYEYVCSGFDFGKCIGPHHKTIHLFKEIEHD